MRWSTLRAAGDSADQTDGRQRQRFGVRLWWWWRWWWPRPRSVYVSGSYCRPCTRFIAGTAEPCIDPMQLKRTRDVQQQPRSSGSCRGR